MLFVAGKGGGAIFISDGFFEWRGVFAEKCKFDSGKGLSGFARVGVEEGGVVGEFPGQTNVGELDEGLDHLVVGVLEVGMVGSSSGDRDKESSACLVLGEILAPIKGVGVSGVDVGVDLDHFVCDDLAGD
jgi:hypothetical protein